LTRFDRRTVLRAGAGSLAAAALGRLHRPVEALEASGRPVLTVARPKNGGALRVGISAESNGINPVASSLVTAGMYYARAIFDPIAIVAADGTIRPYLCRSITPDTTYTSWTFKLRPGIVFHDGTPLDAAALANHFQHIQHSPLSAVSAFSYLTAVQTVDQLTVTLQLSNPWVALPSYLTGAVGVAQLGLVAAPSMLANPNGASHPVGTGPFRFVSWEPGSHLVVERNPHYWQAGLPHLSKITFYPIIDDTSRYQSLQSGDLDLMENSNPLIIGELLGNASLSVLTNLHPAPIEPGQNFVMLNCEQAPLDDVRVRRALAYATDQKKVIAVTGGGLGKPSTGLFSPGTKYYAPTGYPTFDLKKARALVAEYKADKGRTPSFTMMLGGTTDVDQAQQLQQMWKQAGIVVISIDTVDNNTSITDALDGTYQAAMWSQYEAADPDQNYSFWTTANIAPPGHGAINFARFGNATVDAALKTGRADPDETVRVKAYETVSQQFAKYCPYIWINRSIDSVASTKNVTGYKVVSIPSGGHALALNEGNIWMQRIRFT